MRGSQTQARSLEAVRTEDFLAQVIRGTVSAVGIQEEIQMVVLVRQAKRSIAAAVVLGFMVSQSVGAFTVTDVRAQVAQPDYGAGPGVAAGAPAVTAPATNLTADPLEPTNPGVRAAVPNVRVAAPGVQQAGPVAATTLPRTGGAASEAVDFRAPWNLAVLGGLLVGVLALAGRTKTYVKPGVSA